MNKEMKNLAWQLVLKLAMHRMLVRVLILFSKHVMNLMTNIISKTRNIETVWTSKNKSKDNSII
jgi:hypothetical protein